MIVLLGRLFTDQAPKRVIALRFGNRPSINSMTAKPITSAEGGQPGHEDIHRHDLVHGTRERQERRNDLRGHAGLERNVLDVGALVHIRRKKRVSHARHVRGHRAIAEGDENLGPLANHSDLVQILFAAHRTFHQRNVHVRGKLFRIHQRAVDELGLFSDRQQPFVEVQKRHMASGTSIEPHRRQLDLAHSRSSRIIVR